MRRAGSGVVGRIGSRRGIGLVTRLSSWRCQRRAWLRRPSIEGVVELDVAWRTRTALFDQELLQSGTLFLALGFAD